MPRVDRLSRKDGFRFDAIDSQGLRSNRGGRLRVSSGSSYAIHWLRCLGLESFPLFPFHPARILAMRSAAWPSQRVGHWPCL